MSAREIVESLERELHRAAREAHAELPARNRGIPYDTVTVLFSNDRGRGVIPTPTIFAFTVTPAENEAPYVVPQVEAVV